MKVKHKLFLSFIFLFVVILVVGGIGSYYLKWLAKDSEAIIKDNYRTLTYMRLVDKALDDISEQILKGTLRNKDMQSNLSEIEVNLDLQIRNLTEPGEIELTEQLQKSFERLKEQMQLSDTINIRSSAIFDEIYKLKSKTANIYLINESTILKKNEQARQTARKVILYMSVIGGVGALIGLLFIIVLPAYISRPLSTFKDAIREISRGNYQVSIPQKTGDEYGELANSFNKMAAKLNEYESSNLSKVLQEKKRLDAVINQMDDLILGLDEGKHVVFVNQRCLNILRLKKEYIIGRYAPDLAINLPLIKEFVQDLIIGIPSMDLKSHRTIKLTENGKKRLFKKSTVEITERPTGEQHKILIGHLIILTDITTFAEKDLAKTHFIATLSHELKTPVAAIQMSIDLLRNEKTGRLTNDQKELITTAEENNIRIKRAISEILDIYKIENDSIDLQLSKEKPSDIIDRAVDGVKMLLKDKDLKISKDVDQKSGMIRVDAHKTVWVLNNFLTNSIRYSPYGSTITIGVVNDERAVRIFVKDSGPGIKEENKQKIFKKFTKVSSSDTGGTGLGLAISKEFVEAMGGEIGVDSNGYEGSVFWVMFHK